MSFMSGKDECEKLWGRTLLQDVSSCSTVLVPGNVFNTVSSSAANSQPVIDN